MARVLVLAVVLLFAGCAELGPSISPARSPGSIQEALLLPSPYTEVWVELDFVKGHSPLRESVDALVQALESHTRKSVRLVMTEIKSWEPDDHRVWTPDSIRWMHHRESSPSAPESGYGSGKSAYLHVLFLDGVGRTDEGDASGLEFDEGLVVVFPQPNDAYSKNPAAYARRQVHTVVHELGHAFGLVNCGIPMTSAREHPNSRCHSRAEGSVMYVFHDYLEITLSSFEPSFYPVDFDSDDLEDIRSYVEGHTWRS